MKPTIDIDFASECKPYPALVLWVISACLFLLLCIGWYQYQQLKNELTAQQQLESRSLTSSSQKLSPSTQQSLKFAYQTQAALNIAWGDMLSALEEAQLAATDVRLLSVQPTPKKAEIIITGTVSDFSDLAEYITALKKQPEFSDAVLQRQQWEDAPIGEVKLNFILAVKWQ